MATSRQHGIGIFEIGWPAAPSALAMVIVFVLPVLLTPSAQAQTYRVIHNFTGGNGGRDGAIPENGLTRDNAGNLYGTTLHGGNGPCTGDDGLSGCGTVFQLKHVGSGWIFNPIYDFVGGSDGAGPWGRVIFGPDGSLYGTTTAGGEGDCQAYGYSGCGTVYRLSPPAHMCAAFSCPWTETTLYRFSGSLTGVLPNDTVVFDQSGSLYGTTYYGGLGRGVVYKLTPSGGGWTESVIYNFGSGGDAGGPLTGLTIDHAGNLYGTTNGGGSYGYGTVYGLTPSGSGWVETVLYSFQNGSDGGGSAAGLILDHSGNLYSATALGGAGGGGVVFELTPSDGGWVFNLLYALSGSGSGPYESGPSDILAMDAAGNLYGATQGDPSMGNYGAVFKLTPSGGGWTYTALHVFAGGSDGSRPRSNVVFDANGNLYGTTSFGGTGSCTGGLSPGCGVVFQITPPF
jgi:uncharacterized repeat protein (TIGR03803 family)